MSTLTCLVTFLFLPARKKHARSAPQQPEWLLIEGHSSLLKGGRGGFHESDSEAPLWKTRKKRKAD